MQIDSHPDIRTILDKSLVGELLPNEEHLLKEHLQSCDSCRKYLHAGTRVLAGLSGFRFEMDPMAQAKLCAAVTLRAQQLGSTHLSKQRWLWSCGIACFLTLVGSLVDLRFSAPLAALLHAQPDVIRKELLTYWTVPSLWFLLVFLLLPVLVDSGSTRKGRIL